METKPHDSVVALTKREHFAGMAMQGLFSLPIVNEDDWLISHIATCAVSHADALIKELSKNEV